MTDTAKIARITGGNRGRGCATDLAPAGAGTDVVLTYRSNADEAAAVVEEIRALGGVPSQPCTPRCRRAHAALCARPLCDVHGGIRCAGGGKFL